MSRIHIPVGEIFFYVHYGNSDVKYLPMQTAGVGKHYYLVGYETSAKAEI